ncbi:zinc-binding protein A33-like [Myripristis murdjan]|uniref:zinc-binding protein A33-like n=1 Tax=Myripristis murdjan TaxID=586833 RepID=UPI0011761FEF|nr:zinc-binding protein A33-like [Myripristis murdjan]
MASASYMEDLTCSICLTIFTDPVSLLCGHSFCRECITISLSKKDQCPQCRTTVPKQTEYLPTSHILKSLADKAKEAEKIKREQGDETTGVSESLCPEHEEKLKLICETDQQLACVICRDGEKHDGHKFKPIREAATSLRRELEKGMGHLPDDIKAIESLARTQREEITKTHVKSQQLMTQISTQFEEMHQFLRQREEEIKNELKEKKTEAVEEMTEKLQAMDLALSESRELQVKMTAALEISDSLKFLQSWTEVNNMLTPECLFRPRANDLQVARTSLSLGPYESHLQFFVWKEMLQVVKPRAELLSLMKNTDVTVSDDRRSLLCAPKSSQSQSGSSFGQTTGRYGFGSAQATGTLGSSSTFGISSAQAKLAFGSPSTFGFGSAQATGAFGSSPTFGFGSAQATGTFGSSPTFGFGPTQDKGLFGSGSNLMAHEDSSFVKMGAMKTNQAFSVNEFSSGQHYWETEVGLRNYWELGVKGHFLKYDGLKYVISNQSSLTKLTFPDRPRKIGIYLNCSSKELSFYDADKMKHVHTLSSSRMSLPVSAYFNIGPSKDIDRNPLTVCWY